MYCINHFMNIVNVIDSIVFNVYRAFRHRPLGTSPRAPGAEPEDREFSPGRQAWFGKGPVMRFSDEPWNFRQVVGF